MTAIEEKHDKRVALEKMKLAEAEELMDTDNQDDVTLAYEKIGESIKRLELAKDETAQRLIDGDESLEHIREWSEKQKENLSTFRKTRDECKLRLDGLKKQEREQRLRREIEDKRRINEEQAKFRLDQQKETEHAMIRQRQAEEEWLKKKLELQKQTEESGVAAENNQQKKSQPTVKLQKYTITPFTGDYKDWLRFWNQFMVEVDESTISEISKFHYLLELVKEKPRDDILGLPHTVDGYKEAKRILLQNYGKDSKVHKALIMDLESLNKITSIHKLNLIHDFYNKLSRIVRTLSTMGKLSTAQCAVYTLMDKLGPVREVLVQKDDDWEAWDLEQLVEHLRKYVDRNPLRIEDGEGGNKRDDKNRSGWRDHDKLLMGNGGGSGGQRRARCIYCDSTEHTSINCTKVLEITSRREILKRKQACFNCATPGHRASNCRARGCHKCGLKHHTSICQHPPKSSMDEINNSQAEKMGLNGTGRTTSALHPTLHAYVGGEKVRLMVDTGSSSSYICGDVITRLGLRPVRKEKRCIEQMYGALNKIVEIYQVTLTSLVVETFKIALECINAEKDVLTFLPNPNISELKKKCPRLRRLQFCEEKTTNNVMPVHIMLGVADYQRIRTSEHPILGPNPDRDPGAEFTMLGWTVFGSMPAKDESERQFLLQTGQEEFEKLCSLDVLGVADPVNEQTFAHQDFKDQLVRNSKGCYETRLPWKPGNVSLPENKQLANARLHSITRKLERIGKLENYDAIMQEQLKAGMIEPIPERPTGEVVHYVPHQPVIREQAQTTKIRIVYDCSSKPNSKTPSLNDCLETGPSLQPLLFDILLRNRFLRFCITGDVEKAFLQIRVQECDRDAQRILWYDNLKDRRVTEYRFTRIIFGATSSPYILAATLEKHLETYEDTKVATVQMLKDDTYVDDIQGGGDSEEDVLRFKEEATAIMGKAGFKLHKWHSNVREAEVTNDTIGGEQTYAKELVGNQTSTETKILGLLWNKSKDDMTVSLEPCTRVAEPITKRKIIAAINAVYDILGWSSPVLITAKLIFGEICLLKKHWDEYLTPEIQRKWFTWTKSLQQQSFVTVPRSVVLHQGSHFEIHGFSDASKVAVCAAIYVVEYLDELPVNQALLVSKARVAPKNQSIPRLELIGALTLAKLQNNTRKALKTVPIRSFHNWVDSVTVLYWLVNRGTWSIFVRNRVEKINEVGKGKWHYVPTADNPSDFGTRGTSPSKLGDLWFKGPTWLSHPNDWPRQPEVCETGEAAKEIIVNKTMVMKSVNRDESTIEQMLTKYTYLKLLRVTAYILRFVKNAKRESLGGPLTTEEITDAENVWVRIVQEHLPLADLGLTLQRDEKGLWRVDGRVQGYQPIFIPRNGKFEHLLVQHFHEETRHGGVSLTIAKTRERFWIPQIRTVVKRTIHLCTVCKKVRAKRLKAPTTAPLPTFRTVMTEPFAVTGVDFAGPLLYRAKKNSQQKAYVALYTCATTRAVHLKLSKSMSADDFKKGLKEFVARRGSPDQLVSDNALTFKATKRWLDTLVQDSDLFNYLATQRITWKFNMARAPWWGGFFERMIGIMKSCLSKVIGRALLKYEELEEVLLDVECVMNNRPLCYQGEDFEQPVITPNTLLRGKPAVFLEENLEALDEASLLTKRMKYLKLCREQLRKRWQTEYIHALEERHKAKVGTKEDRLPSKGSVVLVTDNNQLKSKWRIGRIVGEIKGCDGVLRGYRIKTGNGYLIERPLQLVCDLEIDNPTNVTSDEGGDSTKELGSVRDGEMVVVPDEIPGTGTPTRRPRKAKTAAIDKIAGITLNEND